MIFIILLLYYSILHNMHTCILFSVYIALLPKIIIFLFMQSCMWAFIHYAEMHMQAFWRRSSSGVEDKTLFPGRRRQGPTKKRTLEKSAFSVPTFPRSRASCLDFQACIKYNKSFFKRFAGLKTRLFSSSSASLPADAPHQGARRKLARVNFNNVPFRRHVNVQHAVFTSLRF